MIEKGEKIIKVSTRGEDTTRCSEANTPEIPRRIRSLFGIRDSECYFLFIVYGVS